MINNNTLKIHHQYQNKEYTCGPTCIKMVADFLNINLKYNNIDDIIKLCGCNPTSGTIDSGMKSALDNLNIINLQNPHRGSDGDSETKSIKLLDDILLNNNVFIMRTLTRGIKHWIIIYNKKNDKYKIADPWLGLLEYNISEIISIWRPRDFDGFIIYV